eukprot:1002984-Pleurochrysis_carterae.AAC.1
MVLSSPKGMYPWIWEMDGWSPTIRPLYQTYNVRLSRTHPLPHPRKRRRAEAPQGGDVGEHGL